jgi:hypothetical protein
VVPSHSYITAARLIPTMITNSKSGDSSAAQSNLPLHYVELNALRAGSRVAPRAWWTGDMGYTLDLPSHTLSLRLDGSASQYPEEEGPASYILCTAAYNSQTVMGSSGCFCARSNGLYCMATVAIGKNIDTRGH